MLLNVLQNATATSVNKQNNVRCWPTFLANYQHKCNYYLDLHEAVLYLSRLTILWVVRMKASVEECLS